MTTNKKIIKNPDDDLGVSEETEKKIYIATMHMCVLWMGFENSPNFLFGSESMKRWSMEEKKEHAKLVYEQLHHKDDNSSGGNGKWVGYYGTKEKCDEWMESRLKNVQTVRPKNKKRGWFVHNQYEPVITPQNQFTVNGMLELLNLTMDKVTQECASDFYRWIAEYTKSCCPEIYDEIF